MKIYITVQEWLDENPSPAVIQKVLNTINRSEATENRKKYYRKKVELNQSNQAVSYLSEQNLTIPKELTERVDTLQNEIMKLEIMILPSKRK